jgi:hypothetical protein
MPERMLSPEEHDDVRHGRRIAAGSAGEGHVRLTHSGELVAIGHARADEVRPVVVFAPA